MFYGKEEIQYLLNDRNIEYKVIEHEAVFTMAGVDKLGLPQRGNVAKNLFLRDGKKKSFYLFVKSGEDRVDLKRLGERYGIKGLTFASEKNLEDILGLHPGAVSPFGVLNDEERKVKVYIDRAFQGDVIAIHPNDNTASVWLKTDDLMDILRAHGNEAKYTDEV